MIKNELVKFFTPFKTSIYGGAILIFILISDVIFRDKPSGSITFHEFLYEDMRMWVFIIPIILAPIVSEVFTYDYESGCMKFFLIYKTRDKTFLCKTISLILITGILILFTLGILNGVYMLEKLGTVRVFYQMELSLKVAAMFLVVLIPIVIIYVLISILFKNSAIISVLTFLFIIMSDFIPKAIGNITPRRFLWNCLLQRQIDGGSILLFFIYLIFFSLVSIKLFNNKEVLK